jgi:uncharacterized protein YbjQ (UPF0145 family)
MATKSEEIAVVNTETIVGEIIEETYGYVSSTYFASFLFRKQYVVEKCLDGAMRKLQLQAFRDGADAIVNVRTTLSIASQNVLFTQVNVFIEGTMVTLVDA